MVKLIVVPPGDCTIKTLADVELVDTHNANDLSMFFGEHYSGKSCVLFAGTSHYLIAFWNDYAMSAYGNTVVQSVYPAPSINGKVFIAKYDFLLKSFVDMSHLEFHCFFNNWTSSQRRFLVDKERPDVLTYNKVYAVRQEVYDVTANDKKGTKRSRETDQDVVEATIKKQKLQ